MTFKLAMKNALAGGFILALQIAVIVRGQGDDDIDGFLFNTVEDPYEDTNLYANEDYADVIEDLQARLDYWAEKVYEPEIPDNYSSRTTFWTNQNSLVSTWLTDSYEPIKIEQRYSYKEAPHIVFLFVDDWGWNDVGFRSNYMDWTTPTIDKLASEGIVLENYYSLFSCIPSRSALLTGRYAIRTGLYGSGEGGELPLSEVTLAQELKSAGYRTYMVGKWHLGMSTTQHTPPQRGFDYFYGYWNGYIDYWTKTIHGFFDLHDDNEVVTNEAEIDPSLHTAYLFQQKAEGAIQNHAENHADEPMFLYYATQLIHGPWSAPQSFLDRCGYPADNDTDEYVKSVEQNYCGLNLLLDEVVANLTCALQKHDMADNTLLLIVSDNGGEATMPGNCYPWRGQKGSYYRGGLMTTAILHSKLLPQESWGTVYNGLVHVTDWMPTLMGLATGGEWREGYSGATIDGVDMWGPITTGEDSPREEILHYHDGSTTASITRGQYTLNKYTTPPPPVVDYSWKFEEDLHPENAGVQACDDPSLIHAEGYSGYEDAVPMTKTGKSKTSKSKTGTKSTGKSSSKSGGGSTESAVSIPEADAADDNTTSTASSGKRSVFNVLTSIFMGLMGGIVMVIIIQLAFKQREDDNIVERRSEADETTRLI